MAFCGSALMSSSVGEHARRRETPSTEQAATGFPLFLSCQSKSVPWLAGHRVADAASRHPLAHLSPPAWRSALLRQHQRPRSDLRGVDPLRTRPRRWHARSALRIVAGTAHAVDRLERSNDGASLTPICDPPPCPMLQCRRCCRFTNGPRSRSSAAKAPTCSIAPGAATSTSAAASRSPCSATPIRTWWRRWRRRAGSSGTAPISTTSSRSSVWPSAWSLIRSPTRHSFATPAPRHLSARSRWHAGSTTGVASPSATASSRSRAPSTGAPSRPFPPAARRSISKVSGPFCPASMGCRSATSRRSRRRSARRPRPF